MQAIADIHPSAPLDEAEYDQEHWRTYAGFRHMVLWFAVHAMLDLAGIAGFVTGHPGVGLLFLIVGTGVLVLGILTTRAAALGQHAAVGKEVAHETAFLADVRPA